MDNFYTEDNIKTISHHISIVLKTQFKKNIKSCKKLPLKYEVYPNEKENAPKTKDLKNVTQVLLTKEAVDILKKNNKLDDNITTKINNEVEETFKLSQRLDDKTYLVIGPLHEMYVAKKEKFQDTKKENIKQPVNETRQCIEIDDTLYDLLSIISIPIAFGKGFPFRKPIKKNDQLLPTSWGGLHKFKQGDYLIISEDGIYRIHKDAFEQTYKIIKK